MGKKHPNYYKTQNFLKGYRAIKAHIKILEGRMEEIKEYKSRGIKAVNTDGVRIYSTSVDKIGNEVVKINEMEEIVGEELRNEQRLIREIDNAINILEDIDADIIKMKFFDNMEVGLIADFLGYERTQVSRRKAEAVKQISKALFGISSTKNS